MKDYFKKSKSFLALVMAVLIAFTMTPVQGVQAATIKASATVKASAAITASGIITNSVTKKVISGASVSLMQGTKIVGKAVKTDSKGKYTLTGLKANTSYSIKVAATGYATYTFPAFKTTKSVTKSKAIVPVFTVSGTIKGAKSLPLKDASVALFKAGKKIGSSVKTDSKGNYKLTNVAYGTGYSVKVAKTGYKTHDFLKFDVKKNVTGKSLTLTANPVVAKEYKVTGKVTEQGATPEVVIADATVKLLKGTTVAGTATTTATGTYEIAKVVAGTYTLEVSADGYTTSAPVTVEVTTANKAQDVALVKVAPTLTAISTVSVTDPTTVVVTLAKAEAGLTKDDFKAETGINETTIATANTVTAAVAGTDNLTYTLTLGTAVVDTNYVKISASTTATKISGNANAKYTAPTETFVSAIAAVNSAVTVTLSLAPAIEAQIADFTITKSINGAAAVTVTPTAIERNGLVIKLTVPAVIASATEQSVVFTAQYKTTPAKSATAFVVAASVDSVVSSIAAVSTDTIEVKLSPVPATFTRTNLAVAVQTSGTTDATKKVSAEAAATTASAGTGVVSVTLKSGSTDTYIVKTTFTPATGDFIAVAVKGTGFIAGAVSSIKYIVPANIMITGSALGVSGATTVMTFALGGSYTIKAMSGSEAGKYVFAGTNAGAAAFYSTPQIYVCEDGWTITGLSRGVTYEVNEATDTTVKLQDGSLGTASANSIIGISATGFTVQIIDGAGIVKNGKYIVSNTTGTTSDTATVLSGTSITGLVNGVTYRIGTAGATIGTAAIATTASTPFAAGDLVITTAGSTTAWMSAITGITLTRTAGNGASVATIAKADILTTTDNKLYVQKAKLPLDLEGTYTVAVLATGYTNAEKGNVVVATAAPSISSIKINGKDLTSTFTADTTVSKANSNVVITFNKPVYSNVSSTAFADADLVLAGTTNALQVTAGTAANIAKPTSGAITLGANSITLNFKDFTTLEPDTFTLKVDMTKVFDAVGTPGVGLLTYQFKVAANPIAAGTYTVGTTTKFVAATGGAPEYLLINSVPSYSGASNYAAVKELLSKLVALDQFTIDSNGKISAIDQKSSTPLTVAINKIDFANPLSVSGSANGITLTASSTYDNEIMVKGTGKVDVSDIDFSGKITPSETPKIVVAANKVIALPTTGITILGTTITASASAVSPTVKHNGSGVLTIGGTGTINTILVDALADTKELIIEAAQVAGITNQKGITLDRITIRNGSDVQAITNTGNTIGELVLEGTGKVSTGIVAGTIVSVNGSNVTGTGTAIVVGANTPTIYGVVGPTGAVTANMMLITVGNAIANITITSGNVNITAANSSVVTLKQDVGGYVNGIKIIPSGTDTNFTLTSNTATLGAKAGITKVTIDQTYSGATAKTVDTGNQSGLSTTLKLDLTATLDATAPATAKLLITGDTTAVTGDITINGGNISVADGEIDGAVTATGADSNILVQSTTTAVNGVVVTATTPLVKYATATSLLTIIVTDAPTVSTAAITKDTKISLGGGITTGDYTLQGNETYNTTIENLPAGATGDLLAKYGKFTIGNGTTALAAELDLVLGAGASTAKLLDVTVANGATLATVAGAASTAAMTNITLTVNGTVTTVATANMVTTGTLKLVLGATGTTSKITLANLATTIESAKATTADIDMALVQNNRSVLVKNTGAAPMITGTITFEAGNFADTTPLALTSVPTAKANNPTKFSVDGATGATFTPAGTGVTGSLTIEAGRTVTMTEA